MLDFLRRWMRGGGADGRSGGPLAERGDGIVRVDGAQHDLAKHEKLSDGIPHPHWLLAHEWIDRLPQAQRAAAWLQCERAWVLHLRDALGSAYRVHESPQALLLTTQDARAANVTLDFIGATLRRVMRLLEELAQPADTGKEILLQFASSDDYYRYVSYFYPSEGHFATSSGMHLNFGCGHFVAYEGELHKLEPIIVHEMTHGLLGHLPIPAWLNEGMAVNAEQRLTNIGADYWSLRDLLRKHRRFWTPETIQEFWRGSSYLRPDEGSELSYDLGRIIVSAMSADWDGFKRFAAAANANDGGAAAAHSTLGLDLGEFVRTLLERADGEWGPQPARWQQPPERGAFD